MAAITVRPFERRDVGAVLVLMTRASAIKWTVLKSNLPAKAFYRSLDGRADEIWELWQMPIDG